MSLATAIPTAITTTSGAGPDPSTEVQLIPSDLVYEVIDGEIVGKPVGVQQSDIAALLVILLGAFVRANRLGRVFTELAFLVDRTRNRQRRPDVAFVSDARWPFRKRAPDVPAWDVVPDLAIEVISPSNSASELQDKILEYFASGVREMWIIYPGQRQLHRLQSPTQIEVLQMGQELDGGTILPGFRMHLSELFEDDPE